MLANGETPTRGEGLSLLDAKRSAHASIRGYLYQTCLGVLRWLNLQPYEILLCEGDEDLDHFLLDGEVVSEQVKAYTGGMSISDQVVRDSLGNFLRSYVALRQKGEKRRFVFTTTAYEKKARSEGLESSLLEDWSKGVRTSDVVQKVQSLIEPRTKSKSYKEIEEARAWLEQQERGWEEFMDAVEWSFGAPELEALREKIERKLQTERHVLVPGALLDRLIVHVLNISSQKEVNNRIVTKHSLEESIRKFNKELGTWACSPEAVRLRSIFDEISQLGDLLDEGTRDLSPDPGPGQILTASFEVIPFDEVGRSKELEILAAWCNREDRRSVLLLTGEGGSGKTRLMIEWCRRIRHQGWHASFLKRNRKEDQLLPLVKGCVPRLIVLDYAETRLNIVKSLLVEMGQATQSEGPKLRVVLLARRRGDWWVDLFKFDFDVGNLLLQSPAPQIITPLTPAGPIERRQAFQDAVHGFAQILKQTIPKNLSEPDLSRKEFGRILYLHMIALLALQGECVESVDILNQILHHERRFWQRQIEGLRADGIMTPTLNQALEVAVTAITLVQGTKDSDQTKELLKLILGPMSLPSQALNTIQQLLRDLYKGSEENDLDPLQPDLLGEQLVCDVLRQNRGLFSLVTSAANYDYITSSFTVLTRVAQRNPSAEHIGLILKEEIDRCDDPNTIVHIRRVIDHEAIRHSLLLQEAGLAAAQKAFKILTEINDKSEEQQWETSSIANNLGYRLFNFGKYKEAVAAMRIAVKIRRKLAKRQPSVFLSDLARSLNNLGDYLSATHDNKEALKTIQEAVRMRRELAELGSSSSISDLAWSLTNLGKQLGARGKLEMAGDALQEAIKLYRSLVQQELEALPGLARSLTIMSHILGNINSDKEAVRMAEEAVEIYRRLAKSKPDDFLDDLAWSLTNLGRQWGHLEDSENALRVLHEAVHIYQVLAERRPEIFQPWLDSCLAELGFLQHQVGRQDYII